MLLQQGRSCSTTTRISRFSYLVCLVLLLFLGDRDANHGTVVSAQGSATSGTDNVNDNNADPRGEDECRIPCLHNTSCVRGHANFSWHPKQPGGGNDDLLFHKEISRNGWHCDCPFGLTGLRCGRAYDTCGSTVNEIDVQQPDHICYNGGQCIEGLQDVYGNDQLYCRCPPKREHGSVTQRFSGKYCEIEVSSDVLRCNEDDEESYCVNGGTCKDNITNHVRFPCHCPSGYTGRHCEFVVGTVPECTLECQNGGECMLGVKDPAHRADHKEAYVDLRDRDHINFQYCSCPNYFYGDYCEIDSRQCGDTRCLHGSTCVEIADAYDGSIGYFCDCTSAFTENKKFAGRHCQHKSTTICSDDMFCTGDGACGATPLDDCDCPDGLFGSHCEFTSQEFEKLLSLSSNNNNDNENGENDTDSDNNENDDSDNITANDANDPNGDYNPNCELDCQNGGTCRKGAKQVEGEDPDFSQYGAELEHMMLNLTHSNKFEHCQCPDGYIGLQCEYKFETCGDNHPCFYGSVCKTSSVNPNAAKCVCNDDYSVRNITMIHANGPVAGIHCQHVSNEICPSTAYSTPYDMVHSPEERVFCVNGGICDVDTAGHSMCRCPSGYHGPHCEYIGDDLPPSPTLNGEDNGIDMSSSSSNIDPAEILFADQPPSSPTLSNDPSRDEIFIGRTNDDGGPPPYASGNGNAYQQYPTNSMVNTITSVVYVILVIAFCIVFLFLGVYIVRRQAEKMNGADKNNVYEDHDCSAIYPDLTLEGTRSMDSANSGGADEDGGNGNDNQATTTAATTSSARKGDGTTFIDNGNGAAAIVRNMMLGTYGKAGGFMDNAHKTYENRISALMRRSSSTSLEDSQNYTDAEQQPIGAQQQPQRLHKHSHRSHSSRPRTDPASMVIPRVDVGPEKDFDGNELNDVSIS